MKWLFAGFRNIFALSITSFFYIMNHTTFDYLCKCSHGLLMDVLSDILKILNIYIYICACVFHIMNVAN